MRQVIIVNDIISTLINRYNLSHLMRNIPSEEVIQNVNQTKTGVLVSSISLSKFL